MTAPSETSQAEDPAEPGLQYQVLVIMPLGGMIGGLFDTGKSWPILGCQICGAMVPADKSWTDNPNPNAVHESSGHTRWHERMGQTWPVVAA